MTRIRLATVAVLVVASLAGCASGTPPISPDPSATVPAGQAPQPAGVLGPRLPVPCADLISASALADTLGGSATSTEPDPGPARVREVRELAEEQLGITRCLWTTSTESLTVAVAADSATAYASWVATAPQLYPFPAVGLTADVGTDTSGSCDEFTGCLFSFAADTYWVEVSAPYRLSAAPDTLTAMLLSVVDGLTAAGPPLPAWPSPVMTVPSDVGCPTDFDPAGSIYTALGFSEQDPLGTPGRGGSASSITDLVLSESGLVECVGQDADTQAYFTIQFLPGSSWVWDDIVALTPNAEAVEVPGADEARIECMPVATCSLDILVADSWARVQMDGAVGYDARAGALTTMTAAIPLLVARTS